MNKELTDPHIITFGCRLNAYESEIMRKLAKESNLSNTIIINTCAVTSEAERQARQAIRKARRKEPNAKIIVTGCAAQISPETFSSMPEVDKVLGNEEKLIGSSYKEDSDARIKVGNIMSAQKVDTHIIDRFEDRTRAFIQVQTGCDHRCTFCIIPFGRGKSRSVPMGKIFEQVRTLISNGVKEIVLSGVDITSYAPDLPGKPSLGQMVRRLLASNPSLPRLRLSSLDPAEIDDDIMLLVESEPRLMPHLHLSLQAGDDMVLKRMKRRHDRQQAMNLILKLRHLRSDLVLGADFIAGFPTESETMFKNTLNFIDECELTYLHVFPFSARPETPAARMPQVSHNVIKDRAEQLRELSSKALDKHLKKEIGKNRSVLIEKNDFGRTEYFAPIKVPGAKAGQLLDVNITGRVGNTHLGVPLGSI